MLHPRPRGDAAAGAAARARRRRPRRAGPLSAAGKTGRPLVVCFGNRLLGDDGVAWHVADRLARDARFRHVDVLARHQLTPELAEDVSRASLVVFVDASVSWPPGAVVSAVLPVDAATARPLRWSHDLSPEALAGLAATLYGPAPPAHVVTVSGASFAAGEELSAVVEAALPAAVDAVAVAAGVFR